MGLTLEPGKAGPAAEAAWQALLRDGASSAAKNLLSAPLGYGVTALFKMLVPDAQTTALREVGDIVRRIEADVARGTAQISAHLVRMERELDQGFRQLTREVFASSLSEPLNRIDYFAHRFADDKDYRIDPMEVIEVDMRVDAICATLLHAPLSGDQQGYLASAASALQGGFRSEGFASVDLLRAAEAFSARFSSGLLAALRGLTLVEASLKLSQGDAAVKARRQRFLTQHLPGLLDAYRNGVEGLVVAALAKAPTRGDAEDATRWRELVDCAFHVLRQADQTVVGAACHLSGVAVPEVWLSGRVIGTARAVAWGQQRVKGLQALCPQAPVQPVLAGLGQATVVRHAGMPLVGLSAQGLALGGPPLLIERDASDLYLLRYALAGFDAALIQRLDELTRSAGSAPVCALSLRGQPALGRIASHSLAVDPVFQPIAVDFPGVSPAVASRHRCELALAVPLPPLLPARAPRQAPWWLDAGDDAVCRSQWADAAQQAWNRVHPQPQFAAAVTDGKAPAAVAATAALTLPEQTADVTALALSPDGQTLACGLSNGHVALWALPEAELLHSLAAHTSTVRALHFTGDGLHLVTGSDDTTVGVWSLPAGQLVHRMTQHTAPVIRLAGVKDPNQLLSVCRQRTYLIDATSGSVLRALTAHERPVSAMAPTADPAIHAHGCESGCVQLVRADSGDAWPGGLFDDPAATAADVQGAGMAHPVTQLLFTPGGTCMAVMGGPERHAQLWDVRAGRFMHLLGGAGFRPGLALWQDQGHQVLMADANGRLQLCDVATGSVLREGRAPGEPGALLDGGDGWWLACGRQVACWPALQLPGASTPEASDDAVQRVQADLGAWLDAADPVPDNLLDARGVVSIRIRVPDAANDARRRRLASQWVALSTCTGHTLAWRFDAADGHTWPPQSEDHALHADGAALPWVAGEALTTAFSKLSDPVGAHGFFRIERQGSHRLSLRTGAGHYVAVNEKGVVALTDKPGFGVTLEPVLLPAGQIALRDERGRYLCVPQPTGDQDRHSSREFDLATPLVATVPASETDAQMMSSPGEACRFTLHFADPGVSPQPAWMDGSVLDAWHRHTVYFTDLAMSGFGGYSESRAWLCELLRRHPAGRAGLTTAESAGAARLKVEVWGVRHLITGDMDRAMAQALGTVKHRVKLHLGVSGQPGEPPLDDAFTAIRDLPFEVHDRWRPAAGSKEAPPVTNSPADADFYAAGEVTLQPCDALWLSVTSELREDWWTRQPNSWATLGVRIRDIRLSWV